MVPAGSAARHSLQAAFLRRTTLGSTAALSSHEGMQVRRVLAQKLPCLVGIAVRFRLAGGAPVCDEVGARKKLGKLSLSGGGSLGRACITHSLTLTSLIESSLMSCASAARPHISQAQLLYYNVARLRRVRPQHRPTQIYRCALIPLVIIRAPSYKQWNGAFVLSRQ